jgi:hypothetical protein
VRVLACLRACLRACEPSERSRRARCTAGGSDAMGTHGTSTPPPMTLLSVRFAGCVLCALPQRSFFRKRLEMPGGEYVCSGVFGDFFEVLFCFPLTACQEARELEIRSMRRWHPLRGFRGKGPCLEGCMFFRPQPVINLLVCSATRSAKQLLTKALGQNVSR